MIVVLLVAAALTSSVNAAEHRLQARIRHDLSACGLPGDRVGVAWAPELQDYQIAIASPREPDAVRLACVAHVALREHVDVQFDIQVNQVRYLRVVDRLPETRAAEREARKAFAKHAAEDLVTLGRPARLPRFDPRREDIAHYLPHLEAFCDLKEGHLLRSVDKTVLVQPRPQDAGNPKLFSSSICLMDALTLAFPPESGVKVGLIVEDAPGPAGKP